MRFDLIDLQLFLHVVEAGSITGGAARAHLALPSCSERIQGMEASLGVPLLLRGPRGVRPTPAGDALVRHARLVFEQLQRLRAELGEHAQGLKGRVRLLCNTAALSEYLPDPLTAFLARHPQVDVELEERASHEVAKAVREGAADVGILSDAVDLAQLENFPFRTDRLVAVAAPALARELSPDGAPVAFARLAEVEQVGLAGDSALFKHLQLQAQRLGRTLHARVRLRGFDALCRAAAAGVGVAIVAEPAARRCAQELELALLEMEDGWARRRLVVCVRSYDGLPRHAQQLVDALRA